MFCRIISGISLSSEFSRFFLPKCRGKIHLFLSPLKLYEQWSVNLFKINSSFLLNFYYCNIIVQNHRYRMPGTQRKKCVLQRLGWWMGWEGHLAIEILTIRHKCIIIGQSQNYLDENQVGSRTLSVSFWHNIRLNSDHILKQPIK